MSSQCPKIGNSVNLILRGLDKGGVLDHKKDGIVMVIAAL